jgi:class 3 adenylate cyclase/predicted ATPase
MFCDLASSNENSSRLDPEEVRELQAEYNSAAAAAIKRFGGYVAKYLPEGIMAYFGWPEAHDEDAENAARAGLAIVEAIDSLNSQDAQSVRPRLSVRIGIDSGNVVIGRGGSSESEVFGDTPNIASRVQSQAEAGTVVVSAAANRLISGKFVVQERGAHRVKGIAEPFELYRIIRLSGTRSRLSATSGRSLTEFVGREEEMRLLWGHWERSAQGEGQVTLVVGEAGIGKSRLVRQFRQRLQGTPHTWNECTGAAHFQNTPFYPISDMLQQGFAERGDRTEEKIFELERDLELAGVSVSEAAPLIAPMLNVPVGDRYPPLTLSPEHQRKRLLATLARWIFGSARIQPTVLVGEDMQLFDASTLELMQLLVERGATSPLLLLFTARPKFHLPWTPRSHHSQLTLDRLSAHNVRALVANVVAKNALSQETFDRVVERTGGVPLFAEELTRAVLEKGDSKPGLREIPVTLHDSLMARLDRLGTAKEVAQMASVVGREFSYALLLEVTSMPEDDLQSALAKLADVELIYARGIPPEATYSFKHALIHDAAYEALLKSKLKQVHEQVARALEQKFADITQQRPELVGHHYAEAGLAEEAIPYWYQAGQTAARDSAHLEAIAHLNKGLELIETLPNTPERFEREIAFLTTLGPALIATKGYAAPEVLAAYDRAHALSQQVGNSEQLPMILFGLFAFYVVRADHEKALALGKNLLALAEIAKDRALLVESHNALGLIFFFRGEFATAHQHLERCLSLYDPKRHGTLSFSYAGQDPGVTACVFSAWAAQALGRSDHALERKQTALNSAEQLSHPYSLAYAQGISAAVHQFRKEAELAHDIAQVGLGMATEHGFRFWSAFQTILLGWVLVDRGKANNGIAQMKGGMEAYLATGAQLLRPYFVGLLAAAVAETESIESGLALLDEALETVEKTGERFYESELYRQKGELLIRSDGEQLDPRKVTDESSRLTSEACFLKAISIARCQQAKWFELRCTSSLARLWLRQGRIQEAHAMLSETYSWFTEGFGTADLKAAGLLLNELDHAK